MSTLSYFTRFLTILATLGVLSIAACQPPQTETAQPAEADREKASVVCSQDATRCLEGRRLQHCQDNAWVAVGDCAFDEGCDNTSPPVCRPLTLGPTNTLDPLPESAALSDIESLFAPVMSTPVCRMLTARVRSGQAILTDSRRIGLEGAQKARLFRCALALAVEEIRRLSPADPALADLDRTIVQLREEGYETDYRLETIVSAPHSDRPTDLPLAELAFQLTSLPSTGIAQASRLDVASIPDPKVQLFVSYRSKSPDGKQTLVMGLKELLRRLKSGLSAFFDTERYRDATAIAADPTVPELIRKVVHRIALPKQMLACDPDCVELVRNLLPDLKRWARNGGKQADIESRLSALTETERHALSPGIGLLAAAQMLSQGGWLDPPLRPDQRLAVADWMRIWQAAAGDAAFARNLWALLRAAPPEFASFRIGFNRLPAEYLRERVIPTLNQPLQDNLAQILPIWVNRDRLVAERELILRYPSYRKNTKQRDFILDLIGHSPTRSALPFLLDRLKEGIATPTTLQALLRNSSSKTKVYDLLPDRLPKLPNDAVLTALNDLFHHVSTRPDFATHPLIPVLRKLYDNSRHFDVFRTTHALLKRAEIGPEWTWPSRPGVIDTFVTSDADESGHSALYDAALASIPNADEDFMIALLHYANLVNPIKRPRLARFLSDVPGDLAMHENVLRRVIRCTDTPEWADLAKQALDGLETRKP